MAPALGVAFALAHTRPLLASGLVLAFAAAHTAVVVLAGMFGDAGQCPQVLGTRGLSMWGEFANYDADLGRKASAIKWLAKSGSYCSKQ